MHPSSKNTVPLGPTTAIDAEPSIFPESRTGTLIPSLKASVCDISTWDLLLAGPKTLIFSIALSFVRLLQIGHPLILSFLLIYI